jgi:TRAP-type mannitol/chloroaromatic compound transport system permease large subunit
MIDITKNTGFKERCYWCDEYDCSSFHKIDRMFWGFLLGSIPAGITCAVVYICSGCSWGATSCVIGLMLLIYVGGICVPIMQMKK